MGRIFESRKTTMFARWSRMAKAFTRLSKDITMAAKAGGADPDLNPALRRVLQNAKAANMPKDRIDAAIKRATNPDLGDYEIVLYEGYGPHGIPILVEAATDNGTRTVANVRMHFRAGGGNLGTTGSVAYMFERKGVFRLDPTGIDADELELDLIDHGLEELGEGEGEEGEEQIIIRCAYQDFGTMQAALEERKLQPVSAELEYIPTTLTELSEEQAAEVMKVVAALEGDDDVQRVFHNLR